jgi:hypothetical protein
LGKAVNHPKKGGSEAAEFEFSVHREDPIDSFLKIKEYLTYG